MFFYLSIKYFISLRHKISVLFLSTFYELYELFFLFLTFLTMFPTNVLNILKSLFGGRLRGDGVPPFPPERPPPEAPPLEGLPPERPPPDRPPQEGLPPERPPPDRPPQEVRPPYVPFYDHNLDLRRKILYFERNLIFDRDPLLSHMPLLPVTDPMNN